MKSLIPMFTAIALSTGAVGNVSITNVNKTEDYYNERKVVDIDFDKERIENKINQKTYKSSNQNEVYVPGSKNKGIQLNSGKVIIPSSDLKIDKEETITVSLWMKWNGNDNDFIPFAFGEYTLWFHNGNFGFSTGKNDIYGLEKGLKAGQMTHVLAEFHKNDVMKNKLFINGKKQELSQLEGSPDNKKATFDESLLIGGWKYDNYHDMDEGIILDEFNVLKGSIQEGEEKGLYLLSKVPELNVYQNGLYAKSEWAIDILDSDLLYQTDFETNDFIPNFKWGYDEFYGDGGQSITTEDKFSGNQSIRTEDTFKNGNWIQWPNRNRERSINVWERFKFKNGIPLSVTYYAKNNGGTKSLIMANGDGGWAESFYDHDLPPVKLTKPMKKGDKVAHVDNPDAFKVAKHGYTLDQDELKIGAVMQVESVDKENKTVTFYKYGVDRDVEEGTPFHFRQWRGAWSFPARNVANEEGWKKVSINAYVTDYKDYDVSKRGGSYYMASSTDKVVYLDNVKFGYATEVELYRDGKKIYKGLMSDFADREAIDKEKPDKVRKATFNGGRDDLSISFDKPKDLGTKYTYSIKGLSKNGETPVSKNKEVEITAGIKGYSYLIDKNPTTIPSNKVNLTTESLKTSLKDQEQYYLHIKSIDNQGNASDTKHIPIEIPTLEAKANHKENLIQLNWSGRKTEPYTHKVFKKKEGEKQFQSVSATDYKGAVKVLNVYPQSHATETMQTDTFIGRDGKTYTLPVSANLKRWMEEPNKESNTGYGMGVIKVDAVSQGDFNSDPKKYMFDTNGKYKYDVVMIGSYDSNGWLNPNKESTEILKDFIKQGHGVLAGHDVLSTISSSIDFLNEMKDVFNVGLPTTYPLVGDTQIQIAKKGLLLNYPWKIGDIGTVLNIPESHTMKIHFNGDIWMKFLNNKRTAGDEGIRALNSNTNAYLHTWNNTAIIQTGHSRGKATPDEQKVLANTLFYLAQLTSDTHLDDRSGQDVDSPTKPNINKVLLNENGTVDVSYNESVDKGTSYEYYVESKGSDTQSVVKSNVAKAEVKTGLKGYSIAIDENPGTIPDEKTETTNASYQLTVPNTKDFYIHVASVDNANNISEVSHYHYQDKFSPELTITASTKDWTNKTITLHVVATDKDSRVKKIGLPNGQWINGSKAEFIVNENGIYYFKAVDEGGNETIQSIIISNIDKKNPTVQINAPDKWVNTDVKVEIIGDDE
ncbi:TPA: hypothetical protein ACTZ3A_001331 [Bacillus cereus]